MVHTNAALHPARAWRTSWWQSALLGIVLIVAGLLVLRDATAATVVSAIVFGLALLCAGLAEIVQAFGAPHWSGTIWRLLLGVLYAIGGGALVADPLAASTVLTLAFAAASDRLGCRTPVPGREALAAAGLVAVRLGHHRHSRGPRDPSQMAAQRLVGPRPGGRHRSHSARHLVGCVQLDRARGARACVR